MTSLGRGELLLNHESPSNGGWQQGLSFPGCAAYRTKTTYAGQKSRIFAPEDVIEGIHPDRSGALLGGSRPLAYDTNKTRRAEAPFGPAGDDNGRRYEPPRYRIGLVMAFMPSRQRLPAAPGKPSFPYLKVYYLPRRCVLAEPSQRTCDIKSPRLDGAQDHGPNRRNPRIGAVRLGEEDGIIPYRLALATILAVNWASEAERRPRLAHYVDGAGDNNEWMDGYSTTTLYTDGHHKIISTPP
ncbi:hypothetical protein THAOC_36653 [Thalassiosira oceanica]|uniref:Uncharacterized protein n=1 Tax=Thalassiosira oceanica TaxID=159749 RepID=K0QZU8_THAOC|nr:hypothetical protein THAOC_36653 [Thalassiosira oceanica]|eukprot:EJK44780.1 hypothetical protein THAOC_36653 [Thalassiosira oceanica]